MIKDIFFIILGYIGIGIIIIGQILTSLNIMALGLFVFCAFGIYCELN